MTPLFKALKLSSLIVPNRIFMAPLTRCRAVDLHIPNDLMAKYYAQRASAGLIIAEAAMVMEGNSAFWQEQGIYSQEQILGWKKSPMLCMMRKAGFFCSFGMAVERVIRF